MITKNTRSLKNNISGTILGSILFLVSIVTILKYDSDINSLGLFAFFVSGAILSFKQTSWLGWVFTRKSFIFFSFLFFFGLFFISIYSIFFGNGQSILNTMSGFFSFLVVTLFLWYFQSETNKHH